MRLLPRSVSMKHHNHWQSGHKAISPESSNASDLFQKLVVAGSFKAVLQFHRLMCEHLRLHPTNINSFFPQLKAKIKSWKTKTLWATLDERANNVCYLRGRACSNSRVLIVGAGPSGLRTAIECQLLGAKVVVVEKRGAFSRNNVLHLWPFVIQDLKNLGAKTFYGKFCCGSIDHISIRQLQLILLKVALLLGVEVYENLGFLNLLEPPATGNNRVGWKAQFSSSDHPMSNYQFDVLVGAGGSKTNFPGFERIELRHKLAIAITANFVNHKTEADSKVEEISGISYIYQQQFFQDMCKQTGADLENLVYYKGDTHYIVMTAKKASLLEQRVLIKDHKETSVLLSQENVDRQKLLKYTKRVAQFVTKNQLKKLDLCSTEDGRSDLALFDFTQMYRSNKACNILDVRGQKLLTTIVGDCLLEPFWPTGTGCARAFLSALDTAWMLRNWQASHTDFSQIVAERELCYSMLRESRPENLHKDLGLYSIDPNTRYRNLNRRSRSSIAGFWI